MPPCSAPRRCFAGIVARRPHALDHLIDPDFARRLPEAERRARILAQLDRLLRSISGLTGCAILSPPRNSASVRACFPASSIRSSRAAYSLIAEASIEAALRVVRADLALKHGLFARMRIAVLGYGKLGGREMTAGSDLDLVVLYEAPAEAVSDGPRPLSAFEYAARLTQRLVGALSAPTSRGVAYEIDLRLRPSGNKGRSRSRFRALSPISGRRPRPGSRWRWRALVRWRRMTGLARKSPGIFMR